MKFHPLAELFPLIERTDFDALVLDVKARGLVHPIVVYENSILDGRNRWRACKAAGVEPRTEEYTGDDPVGYVISTNITRRHLDESQRSMIADRLATMKSGARTDLASIEARSQADAAALLNVSRSNVQRAHIVNTQGAPELVAAVDQGRIAVSAASKLAGMPKDRQVAAVLSVEAGVVKPAAIVNAIKLQDKRALAEEIRANPVVTPDGRYQVIVCDPPWKYDTRAEDTTHRGKNLYPDMTVPEICELPVASLAQDDCILWLWTTNAFMRDAYRCLDAWGFDDKTILTWDKQLIGLGDWLRNVTEHCILAVRGRPVVSLTNQTTLLHEKRREHSRKPEAFYTLVETLCPGSKLEMFSRTPRDGWSAWGAETERFVA